VYGARRILKNAPMILQSFFSLPKIRAMRWMAKWQEQEDGSEKFQHNSVSTKIGKVKVRGRLLFIPLEAKRGGLDESQVLV
jgi:hypothetical protein